MGWFSKNKDKKKKEEEDKKKSTVPPVEEQKKEQQKYPSEEEQKQNSSVTSKSKVQKGSSSQQQQHSQQVEEPQQQQQQQQQQQSLIAKEDEYRIKIDEVIIELAQDIGVEPDKIMEIAELGLNFKSQLKYFIYFLIYYHFDEFVRILAKQNLSLEQKAFQQLVQKNKQNSGKNRQDDQEISQAIQNSLSSTQIKSDKEFQKAILASQKEFDQRKIIQDREDQMLQQAIRLSSIQQDGSKVPQKYPQVIVENQVGHSDSKKIIKPSQKSNDDADDLIKIDDSDEDDDEDNLYYDFKGQQAGKTNSNNNEDFDKMLNQSRLNLQKNLEMMNQKENTGGQEQQQETLQMRIERLKKERQIILQNKKREREDELSQFTDQMSQMDNFDD